MKFLLLALALFCTAFAHQKSHIETNRVMVDDDEPNGTCEECEVIVKKIADATGDKKKMQELQVMLNLMCEQTSHKAACEMLVDQLPAIAERLKPLLKDAHVFCTYLHLCSNPKIETFHKVLVSYAKRAQNIYTTPKIICDECEFAVKELKTVVENAEMQKETRDFLRENVCKTLGSYRGFCDLVVDEYLPQFISEVDAMLQDGHKVCVDIHACDATPKTPRTKYTYTAGQIETIEDEVDTFWNGLQMKNNKGQVLAMSCFECKLLVDGLGEDMITNRKELSNDVQAFACYKIVPANMTASCIDFLSLYLPTVIQMTVEQFTGQGVCQANKCCPASSVSALHDFSYQEIQTKKCPAMIELEKYIQSNLIGSPYEKFVEMSLMDMFCENAFPIFQPMCQQIVSAVTPRFISLSAILAGQGKFSQALNC